MMSRAGGLGSGHMEQIGADLYRLVSSGTAAVHLVMTDMPTLVDAGAPGRGPAIERELQAAGIKIGRIVLTHGDPDHVGGSDHLRSRTGAEVCAAVDERPLLDRSGWPRLGLVRRTIMRTMLRGLPPPIIDRWFVDGDDVGGLQVLATPGHTPGHVAVRWQDWLLAGDAFVSGDRFRESPGIFTIDRATARATIEDLIERAPRSASSSHGVPADRAA